MKLLVRVKKDGRLEPWDQGAWSLALQKYRGKDDVWLTLERDVERRTNPQNRLWFGTVIPVVREFLNQGRTVPLSKEQVHYAMVAAFIGSETTDPRQVPGGPPIPVRSRTLPIATFSELIEKVMAYYITEHGLIFPSLETDIPQEGE